MKLRIDDQLSLEELSNQFTKAFPFLRLEFFHHFHREGGANAKADRFETSNLLGEIRKKHDSDTIEIKAEMKVSDLEKIFKDEYGISVQVFRKSGKNWLETTATDHWTLEKQNTTGAEYES